MDDEERPGPPPLHSSSGDQERPYLYRVRQAPMGHLIRTVHDYSPAP